MSRKMVAEVVTLIPVHRPEPRDSEIKRLLLSREHFLGDVVLIGPSNLNWSAYRKWLPECSFVGFSGSWFETREAYSRLMLQPLVYDHFRSYRYMFLWQLDAILLKKPALESFSRIDYLGAPWPDGGFRLGWNPFTSSLAAVPGFRFRRTVVVGNGGLSLRRIDAFRRVSRLLPKVTNPINEDLIYSFFGPLVGLRISDFSLARATFMEAEARAWNPGKPVPDVCGFHALHRHQPELEQHILSSLLPDAK